MGDAPVGRLLLRYSLPAIAGFLANALYQLVDRILVGRGIGTDGMAAVTAAYPLSIAAMAVGLLIGAGTGNRISVLLGQGDREGAERVLGQSVRLGLMLGAALVVATWALTGPILLACGCEPRLLPMAVPFARISAIGQLFMITLLSMGNILRVQGRPMLGLALMAGGNALNALLAAVVIFVFRWGIPGVAVATSVSQAVGCVTVLAFVQARRSPVRIRRAALARDPKTARAILTLGAPMGAMQVVGMLMFLAANHGAGGEGGTRGVAALGIFNTVSILLLFPSLGVMQSMQPLVGYNKGAGNLARVRALLVRVLLATTLMGVVFSALVTLAPAFVAQLFTKADPELVDMVRRGLPWFVFPITLFGISGTMSHYFMAVHEPGKAAVLLLGRQIAAIPLFLVLPRWLGFEGMYFVFPCADLPFAVVAAIIMRRELARLRRDAITNERRELPATAAAG